MLQKKDLNRNTYKSTKSNNPHVNMFITNYYHSKELACLIENNIFKSKNTIHTMRKTIQTLHNSLISMVGTRKTDTKPNQFTNKYNRKSMGDS